VPLLRRLWVVGALVVGLLGASCIGLPTDSSWGDMSLIGSTPDILFSFGDRIVQVDPTDGSLVELRDADGQVRVDDQGNPRRWTVQTTGSSLHFYSRPMPTTDSNTLVAAAYEDKLYEIDLAAARINNPDGYALPGKVVGNPLVTSDNKVMYMPLSDAGLVALDTADYTVTQTFKNDKGVWAQPLLVEDTLYVSGMDHFLYALDAQNIDTIKWKQDLEGAVASTPVYANGALYVGSFGRKVFKISPQDGTILAQYTTKDWVWGAPAVVDNRVYATDLGGYVYALKDSGSSLDEVWSRKVAEGAIRMTPLVTDSTIVVGSRDHKIYWISLDTGEEIFNRPMAGEVLSNILLIQPNDTIREPMIVVSTIAKEELLVAFSLAKGERRWVYGL
jgi:PQQ-like domain